MTDDITAGKGGCPFHRTSGDSAEMDATHPLNVIERHGAADVLEGAIGGYLANFSGPLPVEPASGVKGNAATLYRVPRGQQWPDVDDDHVRPIAQIAHDGTRSFITGEHFPCIGARAVFAHNTYRYGFYDELAHPRSVAGMARDLRRFVDEYQTLGGYTSFMAQFKMPQSTTEHEFEKLLFEHLQQLMDLDTAPWDEHYSSDPQDPKFSFSFHSCAFFIVGMHSGSCRISRRQAYPTLFFNPESQIRALIAHNKLGHFANAVRGRDTLLQGCPNPSLPTDPTTTGGEPRVYSGLYHSPEEVFVVPLRQRKDLIEKSELPTEAEPPTGTDSPSEVD